MTGSFADWNPTAIPMIKAADGTWKATTRIEAGKHLYKFVVDGVWIPDPEAERTKDDGFGSVNSVLEIEG